LPGQEGCTGTQGGGSRMPFLLSDFVLFVCLAAWVADIWGNCGFHEGSSAEAPSHRRSFDTDVRLVCPLARPEPDAAACVCDLGDGRAFGRGE